MRAFGPRPVGIEEHEPCPICGEAFVAGDFTTLVAIAPADEEEKVKMKAGRPYNAIARQIHMSHATLAPSHKRNCACTDTQISDECVSAVESWLTSQILESETP